MSTGIVPVRPQEPLGVIAGGGTLPHELAKAARTRGFEVVVLRFGEGRDEDWSGYRGKDYDWGRVGDAFTDLRREGVSRLVWAGTLSRRPDYLSLLPSFRTLLHLPQALRVARGGDNQLLTNAANFLKRRGVQVVAVQDLLPELLAPAGPIGTRAPSLAHRAALDRAAAAAGRLGELDIGQAIVASQERVIALEGIEGTREMLGRVSDLKRRGRIGRSEKLALVKLVKAHQDRRFDLPSVGVKTIGEAREAGVEVIGLSAGASLILDYDDTLAAADRHGIVLFGFEGGHPVPADPREPA